MIILSLFVFNLMLFKLCTYSLIWFAIGIVVTILIAAIIVYIIDSVSIEPLIAFLIYSVICIMLDLILLFVEKFYGTFWFYAVVIGLPIIIIGFVIFKIISFKYQLENVVPERVDPEYENKNNQEKYINRGYKYDFRLKHIARIRCKNGCYVRSKAERTIVNFFIDNGIRYEYERKYNAMNGKTYYPDFYLPDYNLFIEYFGMSDFEYLQKVEEKKHIYSQDIRYNFAYLDFNDRDLIGMLKYILKLQ